MMAARAPLRICHVTYSFYESDNRVMRYAETLAARGDSVDVYSLRRANQRHHETSNGVRIYRIQRRSVNERASWVYLLKTAWFLVKCLALLSSYRLGKGYDLVHIHNIPDFLVFAAAVPRLRGTRVILDIHDVVPELYSGKFGVREKSLLFRSLLVVERISCAFAHHVIIANHLWHAKLTRRSVANGKCTPILNYPDLALFRPLPAAQTEATERMLFLYPGTLNHHQGVDIAISAFAKAAPQMPGAVFHIYGDGPSREALRALVRRLELGSRIEFRDRVELREVPRLMASAQAGIVPKRAGGFGDEAFSTKVLEFMACGVPVILARTKVDAHYFTEKAVRFFAPGQPDDLAHAMLELYQHRERRAQLSAAGLQCAQANSWQEHATDYLRIVDTLTGLRCPRSDAR